MVGDLFKSITLAAEVVNEPWQCIAHIFFRLIAVVKYYDRSGAACGQCAAQAFFRREVIIVIL